MRQCPTCEGNGDICGKCGGTIRECRCRMGPDENPNVTGERWKYYKVVCTDCNGDGVIW